ncbi:PIR Superfamily Protein [Plasmodium ovale wallikeri]|uniref:PIR Superfamily Protein n=1 Tax=Plasmodium ovale wallikeri TaxID=864142 RepID=A0A1A9AHS5_PLAOA|nr:PIR Superfamily Protein [Plasmodium ovale wallikeri]SBT57719.1 PIR Superfamily Protein [Plasmodium ovale wallikeri]
MDLEGDNNLNLPSNKCYYELDTRYINDGKDEECGKLEKKSDEYTKAAVLCMGLNGNLKNYDKLNIFQKMNKYKCNYLNLWAYDRLSELEKNEQLNTKSSILTIWIKSEQYKKGECDPSQFATYSNSTDHLTEKKLYDYALNYYELNFRYKENDIIACTRNIAEYISESKELYKKVEQECKHKDAHVKRPCSALENIKTIYPNNELLNLECKSVEKEENTPGEDVEGPRGWQHEEPSGLQHRLQRVGHQGRVAEEPISGLPPPEVGSSSGSHKVAATAVPILGISSIFFLLYKFTGLGSMARNFLRTKGINGINSQEELTNELLENTYDDNAYPDITETYIGYQAT